MGNPKSYVYELELLHPECKTYYTHVGVAKLTLWAQYMKTEISNLEEVAAAWKQLTNEWAISGVGEIRPVIPAEGLVYCDIGI